MELPHSSPIGTVQAASQYTKPDNAIDYAKFYSRSHDAVIRVYDEVGKLIETHEHKSDFKEW